MTAQAPVVVLGAGLAGLTAATYLRRHGIPVIVFEAGPHVAGLARSFQGEDGFTYDFGAHFITNRLAAAVGCSATCRDMARYGETVWLRGRPYRYPFGLMRSPRLLASAAVSRTKRLFDHDPPRSAAQWYAAKYGRRLAEEVACPLTEAWSGVPAGELAAAVGQKFASSIPRTIALRTVGWLTKRTVAVGYCGTLPESPSTPTAASGPFASGWRMKSATRFRPRRRSRRSTSSATGWSACALAAATSPRRPWSARRRSMSCPSWCKGATSCSLWPASVTGRWCS
jgi:phytoene dehydrogenase-like protein